MKHWTAWLAIFMGLLLMVSCAQLPDDQLIAKGKRLEEKGEFDEAIKTFRKVAKRYSNSPLCAEAHYHIALIQANGLQDFSSAITTFGSLIDKYPETKFAPQSQFMIGFIYANSVNDTLKARSAYEKFLKDYPTNELVSSVEWELKYLGKDINDIPELMSLEPAAEEADSE